LGSLGIGLGANSVLLKFSRDAESEADALGSHIMAEAGYDPHELARFFNKLQAGGAQGPQFLSDHPNPGNRERAIDDEIRFIPQRDYNAGTGDFDRVKEQLTSIPAPSNRMGSNRTSNYVPGQSAPAGGWQQLRRRSFSLTYPGNWQAYGDQSSEMVTLAPRSGLVRTGNGNTQVGYGAILSYFSPDDSGAGLRPATDDLIHHLRVQNPRMQVTSAPRPARVDGGNAFVTTLESYSPYGGYETDTLVTVSRPEGLFYMVFVAPERDASRLESAFQQMMASIRFNRPNY
jgi:hypothetical protein